LSADNLSRHTDQYCRPSSNDKALHAVREILIVWTVVMLQLLYEAIDAHRHVTRHHVTAESCHWTMPRTTMKNRTEQFHTLCRHKCSALLISLPSVKHTSNIHRACMC